MCFKQKPHFARSFLQRAKNRCRLNVTTRQRLGEALKLFVPLHSHVCKYIFESNIFKATAII